MLIVLLALISGVGVGYATGGRLGNIEHSRFRHGWLVAVALALQLVAFSSFGHLHGGGTVTLHLISYALLLVFAGMNLHSLGIAVASLGVVCNALVIAANGGYMPARRAALATAGVLYGGASDANSRLSDAGTRFAFLGDVFALPKGVPLANVFSVGDLLIGAGLALVVALAMRPLGQRKQAEEAA